jgi:hypothetical protein
MTKACRTCPFNFDSEEAAMMQNYGCLPEPKDIVRMKEESGHNWGCHYNEKCVCRGLTEYVEEHRPDLDMKQGGVISYETWCHEGEEAALEEVNKKEE